MENVEVYFVVLKTFIDFEVIEIMGGPDPYPTLLGIEWDYGKYGVINLKNGTMNFEADGMKVVHIHYICFKDKGTSYLYMRIWKGIFYIIFIP